MQFSYFLKVLLLCTAFLRTIEAVTKPSSLKTVTGGKTYTTNAICRKNNCINPVFPGLQDLKTLEAADWTCQPAWQTSQYLKFCTDLVQYEFSVLSIKGGNATLSEMVRAQDQMAATAYFFHLSGMNLEAWDYQNPAEHKDNSCIQAIWKMSCNTYLPRAPAYCDAGKKAKFQKPCKNVCRHYVKECSVQCCDESVMCVPEEGRAYLPPYEKFTGYTNENGPSPICTGAASRSAGVPWALLLGLFALFWEGPSSADAISKPKKASDQRNAGRFSSTILCIALALAAVSLQGCDAFVGKAAAAWESRPSYLLSYQFIPEQHEKTNPVDKLQQPVQAVLNSCEVEGIPVEQKCGGNGVCKTWAGNNISGFPALSFCECHRDWMDPECRTRRKSQLTAFALALFGGPIGLDRFYLGESSTGMAKLATFGGFGFWWFWDVARIGSAPVYASHGRLAADLPHFMFVFVSVFWAACLSYLIFGVMGSVYHQHYALKKALLQAEMDEHRARSGRVEHRREDMLGMPTKASYHMIVPPPGPGNYYGTMAAASPQVKQSAQHNWNSTYQTYKHAADYEEIRKSGAFIKPTAFGPPPPEAVEAMSDLRFHPAHEGRPILL
eukprot:TRINITY_DN8908_c0_g1_i1.p1 TRINITY_DN8908_c0_g1~~TRINITY_DN8908_c0_g1_i1.p1  ORF type:complete len:610 (+),score=97.49 TRINITY_DN8908_c0_g1_i1:121-1950(+)